MTETKKSTSSSPAAPKVADKDAPKTEKAPAPATQAKDDKPAPAKAAAPKPEAASAAPTAEAAVASPSDGSPIPATQAQADATTSNTMDANSEGAKEVVGQPVGEAFTGEQTDPYLESANEAKQKDEESQEGKYRAKIGFRHGVKDGREIRATAGEVLKNLSADEAAELEKEGLIEANDTSA